VEDIQDIVGPYAFVVCEVLLVVENVPVDAAEIEDGVEKAVVVDDMDPAAAAADDDAAAAAAAAADDDDDEIAVEGDSEVRIGDTGGQAEVEEKHTGADLQVVLHSNAAVGGSSP
jgi:hypothetical protein